jgi:Ca2+-binding EF-hand superfamily protein
MNERKWPSPEESPFFEEEDTQMKRIYWISAAAVSALTITSLAFAHRGGHGGGHGAHFAKLDQNGDGKVTLAEASAAKDKHFAELDANKDGAVTLEEARTGMQAHKQKRGEERFAERDENKDGKLSRDEVPGMSPERFQKIDANRDGALTRDEFLAAKARRGQDHGERGARMFARVDQDGDGKVTRAEASAVVKTLFDKKDANHDGALTRDELGKGRGHRDGRGAAEGHGRAEGHEGKGKQRH